MVATVSPIEYIGVPPGLPHATEFIHLLSADAYSTSVRSFTESPIYPRTDGGPVFSMERWLRFRFLQPFTQVFDFKFWMPDLIVPTGWTFQYGTTHTYQQPTNGPSTIATGPVPTTKPEEPNVGGVPPLDGDEERYSDWIVLQAVVDGDAPVGPMRGFIGNDPQPLQYRFDWTEL